VIGCAYLRMRIKAMMARTPLEKPAILGNLGCGLLGTTNASKLFLIG